ncbi:MAG: hypothetical protein AAF670_07915 [Planctomycetota bacterium]
MGVGRNESIIEVLFTADAVVGYALFSGGRGPPPPDCLSRSISAPYQMLSTRFILVILAGALTSQAIFDWKAVAQDVISPLDTDSEMPNDAPLGVDDDIAGTGIEIVEETWLDRINPWSEEKVLERRWAAGIETPESLNLEALVLDEAHSFLLFDPVPERLARGVASRWYDVGVQLGSNEYEAGMLGSPERQTSDVLGLGFFQAIESAPEPNAFWTSSDTYRLQLLTDWGSGDDQNIQFGNVNYSQGKKWSAPVPWGRTSIGLELGWFGEFGMIDEKRIFDLPDQGGDVTTWGQLGGYAGADLYQQVIRDRVSVFLSSQYRLGALVADSSDSGLGIFQDSRYRDTITLGGGLEVRLWKEPDLTAQVLYSVNESADDQETMLIDRQQLSFSISF